MAETIRLQVFLSRNGVCSRREAMPLVQSGQVTVNGMVVTEPSFQIHPEKDKVCCQGKEIGVQHFEYVLLHKPGGYVTTKADEFAKKTVMDLVPEQFRHLNPVGRLDKETEGLLLLTNDGDLLFALTHPKFCVGKTYAVRVKGELDPRGQHRLQEGVELDGKKTSPAQIDRVTSDGKTTDFEMTIHEGWNRQVRRMCEAVGYPVRYLKRISQGPLLLGDLPLGKCRKLTAAEIAALKKAAAQQEG